MGRGLLIASFDFSGAPEDEFHDWYDLEHIPERQGVTGFDLCERWIGVDNKRHSIATYDLKSVKVLQGAEYKNIAYQNLSPWSKRVTGMCDRILRFEGTQISPGYQMAPTEASAILMVAINVDELVEQDFNSWYDEEHIPNLSSVRGVLSARRFKSAGGTHDYVALYHLESEDVTYSEAWSEAINTPRSSKIRPHFRDHIRLLAKRYERLV